MCFMLVTLCGRQNICLSVGCTEGALVDTGRLGHQFVVLVLGIAELTANVAVPERTGDEKSHTKPLEKLREQVVGPVMVSGLPTGSGSHVRKRNVNDSCVVEFLSDGFSHHHPTANKGQEKGSEFVGDGQISFAGLTTKVRPGNQTDQAKEDESQETRDLVGNDDSAGAKGKHGQSETRPTSGTNDQRDR